MLALAGVGTVVVSVAKHISDANKKQEELQYASMTTAEKIEHQKQKLAELNKEYEK